MQKILFIHDHKNKKSTLFDKLKGNKFSIEQPKGFNLQRLESKKQDYSIVLFYYNGSPDEKKSLTSFVKNSLEYPLIVLSDDNQFNELALKITKDNIIDFITDPSNNLEFLIYKINRCISMHQQNKKLIDDLLPLKSKVESLTSQITITEKKFSSVFNSFNKPSLFINTSGEILNSNSKASKLIGVSKKELTGQI